MIDQQRLVAGRVVRPHALKGEVVVRETKLSAEEFSSLGEVDLIDPGGKSLGKHTIQGTRPFGEGLLVYFVGVEDIDAAQLLRGARVQVERDQMPPLAEDELYYVDLLGLEIVDENGRSFGKVRRVLETGANEVLEVGDPENPLLLPYHPGVVLSWDKDQGRITVRLPEGLEEIYQASDSKETGGKGSS
jgi:16S rRNA processing protein RimM